MEGCSKEEEQHVQHEGEGLEGGGSGADAWGVWVWMEDKDGMGVQGRLARKNIRAMSVTGAPSSRPTGVDLLRSWASKATRDSAATLPQSLEGKMMCGFARGNIN